VHRTWRADYLTSSPEAFPHTVRLAQDLYPSIDEQFDYGIDLLVEGLRQRIA
jgi:hypothetical protein